MRKARLPKRFTDLLRKTRSRFHWRIARDGEIRTQEKHRGYCLSVVEAAYVASGKSLPRPTWDYETEIAKGAGFREGRYGIDLWRQMGKVESAGAFFSDEFGNDEDTTELRKIRKELLGILGLKEPKSKRIAS